VFLEMLFVMFALDWRGSHDFLGWFWLQEPRRCATDD